MNFTRIFILFFSFFQTIQAQDTLEIAKQYPDNQDLAVKIISVNNRYGIVNDTGKVLMPPQFEKLAFFVADTMCKNWKGIIKAEHGNIYALVGSKGTPLTRLDYDEISFFSQTCNADSDGLVARIKKFGKYGLVNLKGDILIRPSYEKIELLTDHEGNLTVPEVARVKRQNLFGIMELRSKKIMKTEYEKIEFMQTFAKKERKTENQITILLLRKKGKLGIINLQNHKESPAVYDDIELFDSLSYMARVKKGRKFGFMDLNAELKVSASYDYAETFRSGIAIVKKKTKYGAIRETGKDVIPINYTEMQFLFPIPKNSSLDEALFVKKNGVYGLLDVNGKTLIPVKYDKLEYSEERGNFEAHINGKTEFIKL